MCSKLFLNETGSTKAITIMSFFFHVNEKCRQWVEEETRKDMKKYFAVLNSVVY